MYANFAETVDYAQVSVSLTFTQPGIQCFDVTILDDNIPNEGDETFQLLLSIASFPSISDVLTVIIADDPGGE